MGSVELLGFNTLGQNTQFKNIYFFKAIYKKHLKAFGHVPIAFYYYKGYFLTYCQAIVLKR